MKKYFLIIFVFISAFQFSFAQCRTELWRFVYHPDRFTVYKKCFTITGTVMHKKKEADGDYHIRLKLDAGQPRMLNQKNMDKQGGCLVLEIICMKEPTQEDAIQPCRHCPTDIFVPKVGDHVKVTGSFVKDNEGNHGWNEIHPVSTIEKL